MALEGCNGQMDSIAHHLGLSGRLVEPAEVLARLDAVTVEDLRATAHTMLAGPRAVASIGGRLARAA